MDFKYYEKDQNTPIVNCPKTKFNIEKATDNWSLITPFDPTQCMAYGLYQKSHPWSNYNFSGFLISFDPCREEVSFDMNFNSTSSTQLKTEDFNGIIEDSKKKAGKQLVKTLLML